MKKFCVISLLLIFAAFYGTSRVFAQDLGFERAYNDYLFTLTNYRNTTTAFDSARNNYKNNPTLSLKESARQETYNYLVARDELIVVYLTALRARVAELAYLTRGEKEAVFSGIDSDVPWYTDHSKQYKKDEDSLESLFNKSKETDDRYILTTQPKVRLALASISMGKFLDLRQNDEDLYDYIKGKVGELSPEDKKIFDRWIADVDNLFGAVDKDQGLAKKNMDIILENHERSLSYYNKVLENLNNAMPKIRQITEYIGEMLKALKGLENA